MSESVNYKCPACGGPLRFDAVSGQLQCDYCGSQYSVAQVEAIMAEQQSKADQKDQKQRDAESARVMDEAASVLAEADAARAAAVASGAMTEEEAAAAAEAQKAAAVAAAEAQAAPKQSVDPIQEFLNRAPWADVAEENVRSYTCSACAAELLVDGTTAITECPYCGNQAVVPNQVSGVMKPDYVIPFKITKDQAVAALKKHYEGKSLLPNAFKDQNHLEHVQGVYVPFWLYTYKAEGDMHYRAERVRTWVDARNDTMQETTTYDAYRKGSMIFANVPADGSSKMPDAHMDAIEPFDYSEMKPFSVAYLPGFAAERYDLDAEAMKGRVTGRMEVSVESALRDTVEGFDSVVTEDKNVSANLESVSYAMLPVWMLHTRWNNQDYLFAMNGQTGKFIGDLPIDGGKVMKWYLGVGAAVFAAAAAVATILL